MWLFYDLPRVSTPIVPNSVKLMVQNKIVELEIGILNNSKMAYFDRNTILEIEGPLPWREVGRVKYSCGMEGFHEEVEDFFAVMSPTPKEIEKRAEIFQRIRAVILGLFPSAKVETYGSSRIGVFLPTSDVDILVLVGSGELDISQQRRVLNLIKDELISQKFIVESDTELVDAKLCQVAVLKVKEKISTVNVDIVAKKVKGPESAELIQSWFVKWPMAPKLFLVLKQFIVFHKLDGVYSGGMNSYTLIIMIICFLRKIGKERGWGMNTVPINAKNVNLGGLLYEFLFHYGKKFNYYKLGLRISDGGSFFEKQANQRTSALTVEDPLEKNHNISSGTFHVENIKYAFSLAADTLSRPINLYKTFFPVKGYLGRIVRVSAATIAYRKRIVQDFTEVEIEKILNQDHYMVPADETDTDDQCTSDDCGISFEWMSLLRPRDPDSD